MTPTTDRTALVFAFICDWKSSHDGNSPTLDELVAGCGIPQTTLVYHLLKLQRQGRITLDGVPRQARQIRVVGGRWVGPDGNSSSEVTSDAPIS